jgi:D-alanyl-D-alanine carboxypeptidase (penicillin-binding protein 5/6)
VGTKQTTVSDLTGKQKHVVKNTNQLLQSDSTVVGVKTGTTEEAGQVLITQFERNGHQVVLVVLGSTDRYADTTAISDWLWSTYSWLSPEEFLKMEK